VKRVPKQAIEPQQVWCCILNAFISFVNMIIKYSEHEHFNARIYIIHSITKDWTVTITKV